jgi:NADPH-dependent curcumin reductase CurA
MPGMTALSAHGHRAAESGETVVVSAASGAVGAVVGQLAKIKGCRAVGIAGSPDKCRYVVDELGFDACMNYKTDDLVPALRAACPNGVDIYFENVGGAVLAAVLKF